MNYLTQTNFGRLPSDWLASHGIKSIAIRCIVLNDGEIFCHQFIVFMEPNSTYKRETIERAIKNAGGPAEYFDTEVLSHLEETNKNFNNFNSGQEGKQVIPENEFDDFAEMMDDEPFLFHML